MKNKLIIIFAIVIILSISIIISVRSFISYKNNNAYQLELCIEEAKLERENLWDSNCEEDDGNCYISDMEAIEWIEARYEQDLWNCFRLYD